MSGARILRVSGALVEAAPLGGCGLYELARVGRQSLLGEIIRLDGGLATLQVYEDTNGLAVDEPVAPSGAPLTMHLGPGLLGSVLDGVGRPLAALAALHGDVINPGGSAPSLDPAARWTFTPSSRPGDQVRAGDVLGTVDERGLAHRILVPPGVSGTISDIASGTFGAGDRIGGLAGGSELRLGHHWPVRVPRPAGRRLPAAAPFITGQRIFDFLFPVPEGGSVAVPGGFGTGKTVIEQSLARYAAADVVVYIGCGERGNEMAEVLEEFPRLTDPRTGRAVMDRTVLVVNTSDMPVAAREASVYVGMSVAEYYRDQGYRVAVMADSLSRWAEAAREMGARLQEMPGEEGYPTYLGDRLGKFYERSGLVEAAGRPARTGSVTLIGAVSPPGGDFSEPVTQAVLRVAGALWALDPALAHERHFPAVDWETSYTLGDEATAAWFREHAGADWSSLRADTIRLLQRDRELREIAGLIGPDALQDKDRLLVEAARLIRETVLAQSAYDPGDAWSPLEKTHRLAQLGHRLHATALRAIEGGRALDDIALGPAGRLLSALRRAPPAEVEARAAAVEAAIAVIGA